MYMWDNEGTAVEQCLSQLHAWKEYLYGSLFEFHVFHMLSHEHELGCQNKGGC